VKVGRGNGTNAQPHTLKRLGSSEKGARGALGTQEAPGPVQHSRTHTDTGKGAPRAAHADSRRQSHSQSRRVTGAGPVGSLGGAGLPFFGLEVRGGGSGPRGGAARAGAGRAVPRREASCVCRPQGQQKGQ